jgi:Mg-chelatase subunit ChlD
MKEDLIGLNRWRLVLGKYAEDNISFSENSGTYSELSDLLEYLYDRDYDEERGVRSGAPQGGKEPSNLTVPSWITKVRTLFPKETVEVLEKHALEKYNMKELLTDKKVLEAMEPNAELLKNIMQMKHLMKGEALETARKIVKKVVDEITKSLENEVKLTIMGKVDRSKNAAVKSARNIDFKKTIRANLKNYDKENERIIMDKIYFYGRVRKYNPWNVIVAVDESGSMLPSVIHSAIMAGIFSKLPMLKTNLVIFDTEVVDLTSYVDDAVQTLMSVQLGGGTNIGKALRYCEGLIENSHRTIVVMVTDLYDGYNYKIMYSRAKAIIETGAKLIILTALDNKANSAYDKTAAKNMAALGAEVAAMTPGGLAKWIAKIIS